MNKEFNKTLRRKRVRAKISGTAAIPRLSVAVSLSHIRAQVIDDVNGVTLAGASDLKIKEKMTKIEKATKVGEMIAEAAQKAGVKKVVFDRGPKLYHGRVKALAEAARDKGLDF
jgi:large subunit ribosomal protein L18